MGKDEDDDIVKDLSVERQIYIGVDFPVSEFVAWFQDPFVRKDLKESCWTTAQTFKPTGKHW